jgi:hypothetical protein
MSSGNTGGSGGSGGDGAGGGSGGSGDTSSGGSGGTITPAGGGSVDECAPFSSGDDFKVCTATYLTGDSDDTTGGVVIGADGAVVYGGTINASHYGKSSSSLLAGGGAGVVRLSPNGRQVLSVVGLGNTVTDIDVQRPGGNIAVSGDFGVAMLDAKAEKVVFEKALSGEAQRVAIGSDGTVAALVNKQLTVLSASGAELSSFGISTNQTVHDIAVDGASQTVMVTGFKQDDGGGCTQLQVPFIRAYGYDGAEKWKAYDWRHADVAAVSECADSRGLALGMGLDGKLYYAGRSDGGNTVHNRLPTDLSKSAPNQKFDKYTDAYNMNGAAPVAYLARFDPATGAIESGVKHVVRRYSDDKGNAMIPLAITALADGTVFAAGTSACCIPGQDVKTVNGELSMPGYAGGGWILMLAPDMKSRLAWTVFRGPTGAGETPIAVATDGNAMAVAMSQSASSDQAIAERALLTFDAVQPTPGGGSRDSYLAVWPAP